MRAGDLMLGAARIRAQAEMDNGSRPVAGDFRKAGEIEGRVRQTLPDRLAEVGAGGELVPHGSQLQEAAVYRSTVEKPDYIAAAASRERLDLAHQAGVLDLALDTADTIDAENSLVKMLSHQLAAAHRSTMKLTEQINRQIERMNAIADGPRSMANVEATRLAGGVARLMQAFQQGVATLQRQRTGGHQVLTVQHVKVAPGGQAIVAGTMATGGRPGPTGEGQLKMKNEPHGSDPRHQLEAANAARRCGASSKSNGQPCRRAAMLNGRCWVHGGASTGPRTAEGLERSRKARWRHGYYSMEARKARERGAMPGPVPAGYNEGSLARRCASPVRYFPVRLKASRFRRLEGIA